MSEKPSDIELKDLKKKNIAKKNKFKLRLASKLVKHKTKGPYTVPFPCLKRVKKANRTRTTKYTLLTFLPLNLMFQV
jgi:hypothetical protein